MINPTDILPQIKLKSDQASYKFNNNIIITSFITNNSTVGLHHVFSVRMYNSSQIETGAWRYSKLYAHITP